MVLKKANLILFIVLTSVLNLFAQNNVPKQGGICFRVDDNGLIEQFRDYTNVFEKYNQHYNFALNLAFDEFNSQDYIDSIKVFQNLGNELMDHTPNHRTNYFITKFDTALYSGENGVDHIIDDKICLKHLSADLSLSAHSDTATIDNNKIIFSEANYDNIEKYNERYIYLPGLDTLVLVKKYKNNKATVTDIWNESINLGYQTGITYYTFTTNNINLTSDAIYLLANETQKLANLYGLTPPTTWIQPGGNFVEFDAIEIKAPMESLGYTAGATYPNKAIKVYNEYNPNGEQQFAMQWGDFIETDQALEDLKSIIADGVAKHKMLIGNSHWYSDEPEEWEAYLIKNDSLLNWATSNSIPIKTYFEWSDLLYNQTPNPYYNIMPPLNVDKDVNGIPDGYTNIDNPGDIDGTFVIDTTTPGPGANYYSIATDEKWHNKITYILGLGGFEKGENDFSIWTKGAPGDSIKVVFAEPWPSNKKTSFKFSAESTKWEKQSLAKQGKSFFVHDTTSILDIEIYCSNYTSDTVKIAGMSLTKMVTIENLEMNVLSTLPAPAGDSIFVEIIAKDEFGNPHDNYLDYFLTSSGSSSVNIFPSTGRSFNGNARDTILVIDTVAGTFNLTAKLINDTLVADSKEISIKPRNIKYLNILSSTDSIMIGDTRLLQVALEDTFKNRIPDSLITYEALSGNGKFSNGLQNIAIITDSIGVAKDLYTASTSLSYKEDTIKVHYNNSIIDTIFLPLKAAPIAKFELVTLSTIPAITGDSVFIEITAKDTLGNEVVSSSQYKMTADSSLTAWFVPSNIYSFNNSIKDTVIVIDTVAGSFYAVAQLLSDSLVIDSTQIEFVYSSKQLSIRIMLEGPYTTSKQMATDINSQLPLQQPYNTSPWNYTGTETVTEIPLGIVDWILVTLRKDVDSNNPDPATAIDIATKAAFVKSDGYIVDLNGIDPISFNVKEGEYYIVVEHRNHLAIMSKTTVLLSD